MIRKSFKMKSKVAILHEQGCFIGTDSQTLGPIPLDLCQGSMIVSFEERQEILQQIVGKPEDYRVEMLNGSALGESSFSSLEIFASFVYFALLMFAHR